MDVWLKEVDGVTPALGRVWPEDPTYFGDFSNPDAQVGRALRKKSARILFLCGQVTTVTFLFTAQSYVKTQSFIHILLFRFLLE